jgi:predicted nucleic acid-binding protein
MNVYVESNFILELVTVQLEHCECAVILERAERRDFRLVVPAFSVVEPLHTIRRRHSERMDLQQKLNREINLLARSATYEDRLRQAAAAALVLDDSRREEQQRLDDVLERIASSIWIQSIRARRVSFSAIGKTSSFRKSLGNFANGSAIC